MSHIPEPELLQNPHTTRSRKKLKLHRYDSDAVHQNSIGVASTRIQLERLHGGLLLEQTLSISTHSRPAHSLRACSRRDSGTMSSRTADDADSGMSP